MKNKYQTVKTVPKFNRKIVEISKFVIPSIHMHDRPLSGLSTTTLIKSDGVKLVGINICIHDKLV
jgi:hypothetical protein